MRNGKFKSVEQFDSQDNLIVNFFTGKHYTYENEFEYVANVSFKVQEVKVCEDGSYLLIGDNGKTKWLSWRMATEIEQSGIYAIYNVVKDVRYKVIHKVA